MGGLAEKDSNAKAALAALAVGDVGEVAGAAGRARVVEALPAAVGVEVLAVAGQLKGRAVVIEVPGQALALRGHAWAGDHDVAAVHVSIDFGATWQEAALEPPANRFAWQHWAAEIEFPQTGYYEMWARATDSDGKSQPMVVPGWNPKGYLNNACHRIAVLAEA